MTRNTIYNCSRSLDKEVSVVYSILIPRFAGQAVGDHRDVHEGPRAQSSGKRHHLFVSG